MHIRSGTLVLSVVAAVVSAPARGAAADPFNEVSDKTNSKMVKVFGAGGFSRLNNFGTGIVISPDGHILTVASQLLDTSDLVVHLYDGRRLRAEVMVVEPELDAALLRIRVEGKKPGEPTGLDLPYFDFAEAVKRPAAEPGDWILGFTNQFEIALRDEPLTVQRGVIAARTKLSGRVGVFDFPYTGEVYVVDAITNNPGAAGGALTDRKGNLLGIIGREIKNTQTETGINYAIPVGAKVTITVKVKEKDKEEERTLTLSLPDFVARGMKGEYKPTRRDPAGRPGDGGWSGIVFVPNILSRTPAYVEDVIPGSPAAKAGLRPDDLISFVDGEPIVSITAFQDFLRVRTRPGTTIRVDVRRGEALQTVEMTLGVHPPKPTPVPPPKKP
ncbi:MAG: serine protease [Gemmataceae bacterium]|nr:serine protease [Gemmataceae bacterium]